MCVILYVPQLPKSGAKNIFCAAVALKFVLDLDEEVYSTFAPVELKSILEVTKEFTFARKPAFKGLDHGALSNLLLLSAVYAVVHTQLIDPQNVILDQVYLRASAMYLTHHLSMSLTENCGTPPYR